MSVVIKKIGAREYAYVAYRSGGKVAQKYVGPLSDPQVASRVAALREERRIPGRFRSLFWDTDPAKVDLNGNARYVIERVLDVGGLAALNWLQRIYPTKRIIETCETSRKLPERSRNFWRLWFDAS